MPEYKLKCENCGKVTKTFFPLSSVVKFKGPEAIEHCNNCDGTLYWRNIQIEFQGAINMNASQMGINQRTYRNKAGGPVGLSGGKPVGRAKI